MKGDCAVKRSLLALFVGTVAIAATLVLFETKPISAKPSTSSAVFDSQGRLKLPTGYRRWVYLGVSLTPNGLNKGEAPFPEFHHVYVEESNLDAYLKTGSFPEGTVLAKESLTPTAGVFSLSDTIRCRMPRQLRSLPYTNVPVAT